MTEGPEILRDYALEILAQIAKMFVQNVTSWKLRCFLLSSCEHMYFINSVSDQYMNYIKVCYYVNLFIYINIYICQHGINI